MRIVIKFAGALLEDDATVRSLARQVAALAQQSHEILVVHGGGRLFTATPKRMVHNEVEGGLGFVGYLTGLNAQFIESLWHEGLLPVAPCLGLGSDNELYNINADHMAAACAEYLNADRLIYLTDVAGVLDGERVLSAVACGEIERLVQCRIVSGGMVLKLEAAKRAIEGGVREVRIVGGTSSDALLLASHAAETSAHDGVPSIPGTRVLREPLSAVQAALS